MKFDIHKILVPTDFSETSLLALEHAALLARLTRSDLMLAHVVPVMVYYDELIGTAAYPEEPDARIDQQLEALCASIRREHGILPSFHRLNGRVAGEIMELASREAVNLIVMGTHGVSGFEELFIGSTAHKVVNLAPCPVITIQTRANRLGFRNIVLPIDRSLHSREKVEIAIGLATLYAAKLHILGLLESNAGSESDKLQITLDQVESCVRKSGLPYSRQTVQGNNLATEALKYGNSIQADLIIIMTDHESKMNGIFMGPVAKQIVNHSRIPVMSIKPHYGRFGFIDLSGGYTFY